MKLTAMGKTMGWFLSIILNYSVSRHVLLEKYFMQFTIALKFDARFFMSSLDIRATFKFLNTQ